MADELTADVAHVWYSGTWQGQVLRWRCVAVATCRHGHRTEYAALQCGRGALARYERTGVWHPAYTVAL